MSSDPWMMTATGLHVHLLGPGESEISPTDLAIHLSNTPRFAGAVSYSVAQHSVRVARLLAEWSYDPLYQFIGLIHDAHEAYTGDMISPWKKALATLYPDFPSRLAEIERKFLIQILKRAGIDWLDQRLTEGVFDAVKEADLAMLWRERQDLFPQDIEWSPPKPVGAALIKRVKPWTRAASRENFQNEWRRLSRLAR